MLSVLSFWLIVQLFALAALPLAWRWLSALPSRGYALAKPLGLLLVTYVLWLGGSVGLLRNSAGGVLFSLALVAALSVWLGREGLRELPAWLRANWLLVAVSEALFLVALLGWAWVRSYSPEITTAGGEKFMELTFLNGILRSQTFPPLDPWLSGFAISYYYFGYVMLAALTRLSGLAPSVAFNAGLATWFALTVTTAFGVAFDMAAALVRPGRDGFGNPDRTSSDGQPNPPLPGVALVGGLLGGLFVALLSNLEGFLESLFSVGVGSTGFWRWLDVKDLNCLGGPAFSEPIANCPAGGGGLLPERFFWWWRASRVINDRDLLGNAVEVIDEFPFFSFLLGDMHPHVLALPFVLLAVGLALALMLAERERGKQVDRETRRQVDKETGRQGNKEARSGLVGAVAGVFPLGAAGFGLYALCLGGLAFLNTWDFPIYVFLVTLALGARLAWQEGELSLAVAAKALLGGLGLGLLGVLLYLPFYVGFQSQAGGILPNFVFPTRFSQFFVMFGPLLAAAIFLLLALSRDRRQVLRRSLAWLPWTLLVPVAFLFGLLVVGVVTPSGRELVRRVMEMPAIQAQVGDARVSALQLAVEVFKLRIGTPWVYLLLAGLIAWVLGLLAVMIPRTWSLKFQAPSSKLQAPDEESRLQPAGEFAVMTFALLALLVAFLLAFSVEFVYLRDTFGTRMNTVFKFYYQAWVLLALAGAFSLVYLSQRAGRGLRLAGISLVTLLAIGGLFYPVFATYTRAERFASQPTLDGTAYLVQQNPADSAAVAWLRANVPGNAVVLESYGGSYTYAGRISAQTGLTTLLGWDGHELQWRGDTVEQDQRRPDIDRIYRSASAAELQDLLEKWQIDYVLVGDLERRTFGISPQSEARLEQAMDLVYDADGVRIYRRRT